jgi:hypothetical protein
MAVWYELPNLFPIRMTNETAQQETKYRPRWTQADSFLVLFVVGFLFFSYCCCRFYRGKRRRHTQRLWETKSIGGKASKNDYPAYARVPEPSLLVSEMNEPFLRPADYEQPPAYEPTPPAYEHLPSAPPLPF